MTKSNSSLAQLFAHLQNGSRISLNLYLELVNSKIMEIMEEGSFTKKFL